MGYQRLFQRLLSAEVFLAALFLFFISDIFGNKFHFFYDSTLRSIVFPVGVCAAMFFLRGKKITSTWGKILTWPGVLFLQGCLVIIFLRFASNRIIFSDDHPSFLYRLFLLKDNFPRIPFYNTDWNGGYETAEFFLTGVLNIFILVSPFLYLLGENAPIEIAKYYTLIIPYLYMLLLPWSMYIAARLLQISKNGALISLLLSLGPSYMYFKYLLSYGTLGFVLSAAILPLCLALAIRIAVLPEPRWSQIFGLLLASFCCLSWLPSAFGLMPITFFALFHWRETFSLRRRKMIFVFAFLFLVINVPWLFSLLKQTLLISFVSGNALPGGEVVSSRSNFGEILGAASSGLLSALLEINPLLLFFVIPGIRLLPQGRKILLVTIVWLLVISFVGDFYKPQLELQRMILHATFLMILPAARSIEVLNYKLLNFAFEKNNLFKRTISFFSLVFLLGILFSSPLKVCSAYLGRSAARYLFARPVVAQLSEAIKKHGGEGRVFFLGFILHELNSNERSSSDGGHVAALASFSGKPLYASEFYHSRWSSNDPIPEIFRDRESEGVEEFLDLMNATAVVTFTSIWERYCNAHAERYEKVFMGERFSLFKRKGSEQGYFQKGFGSLRYVPRGVEVIPGSEEMVIKFRFHPKLRVTPAGAAEIEPYPVFTEEQGGGVKREVSFVSLRVSPEILNNGTSITIHF